VESERGKPCHALINPDSVDGSTAQDLGGLNPIFRFLEGDEAARNLNWTS
jgi:hypothetical protein